MGTWGPDIYQDDLALDCKDKFVDLLRRGNDAEEITEILGSEHADVINDLDIAAVYWFALIKIQE